MLLCSQVLVAERQALALERVPSPRAAACRSSTSVGCHPLASATPGGCPSPGKAKGCTSSSVTNSCFLGDPHFQFPARVEGGAARPCDPDGRVCMRVLRPVRCIPAWRQAWHVSKMPRAFTWGEVFMRNCSVEDLGLKEKGLILRFLLCR